LSLGLFNEKKEEERVMLENIDDIYSYEEKLKAAVSAQL
jgi:hypothetical protein